MCASQLFLAMNGACPAVWLIHTLPLYLGKLISLSQQVLTADSFLVYGGTLFSYLKDVIFSSISEGTAASATLLRGTNQLCLQMSPKQDFCVVVGKALFFFTP